MGDVHKSILNIKPRVTLEQANLIAEWAGEVSAESPDGAMPMGIARFKQLYTVRDHTWIERASLKHEGTTEDRTMPSNMTIDVDGEQVSVEELIESYREYGILMSEPYPNEHAARLEDPKKYIRVRRQNDKFGPGIHAVVGVLKTEGPRGGRTEIQAIRFDKTKFTVAEAKKWLRDHKYKVLLFEPAKEESAESMSEVIRKKGDEILLYDSDGEKILGHFPFGDGKKYKDEETARKAAKKREGQIQYFKHAEMEEDNGSTEMAIIAVGPTTFADLLARKQAREAADEVYELTYQFQMLANNVMASTDIDDKVAALKSLAAEYVSLIEATMAGVPSGEQAPEAEVGALITEIAEADGNIVTLSESDSGSVIEIVEDNQSPTPDNRAPLKINVRLIRPGWGNKKDNHFYPAEVLKRDAHVFEGAKMYVTDHRPGEKSERTEVSVIEQIVGFEADGAPIARVAVFDPEFAEKTRNRAALNQLSTLECSILATGKARKGKAPDGAEGNIVEAITDKQSVDWVTKAGAGGAAIALAESVGESVNNPAPAEPAEPVQVIAAPVESAVPPEPPKPPEPEPAPEPTPMPESVTEVFLSESDVKDELGKRPMLHTAIKNRVASAKYHTLEELNAALDAEVTYFKAITGSGEPFAQGASQLVESRMTDEEHQKHLDEIDKRYGLR
jgi:hypothetical protein